VKVSLLEGQQSIPMGIVVEKVTKRCLLKKLSSTRLVAA
jgi:hypothetical protein